MTRRGRFISFEGGEGAGKSTHVRRLTAWLQAAGINVLATREPGGPPGAEALRALLLAAAEPPWSPLSEVLLHYAARREHLDKTIEPALARGTWVVCDAKRGRRGTVTERSEGRLIYGTHLTVDVVPGRGSGFSVEAPEGVRFLIRSDLMAEALPFA